MFSCSRFLTPVARSALISASRSYVRPMSAIISQPSPVQAPPATTTSLVSRVNYLTTGNQLEFHSLINHLCSDSSEKSSDFTDYERYRFRSQVYRGWCCHSWSGRIRGALIMRGAGIGTVFGSLIIGYARNPSLKQQLFSYAILGFALSEAMGLFCLMMAFLLLFAF
ncbi:hypothetical protein J437_LFUL014223 [Ladona fulva]|uniref:ATPase protein 9 n=1 Tax=Ladona fulva TaxID=123851 RepID=A0A8K0KLC2_LADFU|nr:hypothetical protein J437_LFUL014223 [Ladona fulva]